MSAQSDFDFFIGRWSVQNSRLSGPLTGGGGWEEFEGVVVAWPILGGAGNMNEYEAVAPSGIIRAMALRLFNPTSAQWSIYWASAAKGTLDWPPMVGSFDGGRGEFYNQEMLEGRAIFVRFVWSDIMPSSCRWEQAFSCDGGRSWEPNWIMRFARK